MRALKRHLSFANVISCLALFMAMSGVAFAATNLARNSVKPQHIKRGAVTTPKLRNGAVTAQKLRNGAVTTFKLRNGAVVGAKLRDGAVSSAKIADRSVRAVDLGGGVVTTPKLKNDAVTTEKLAAGGVATGKLADGAVTAAKLLPGLLAQLARNVSYETKKSPSDSESPKTVEATCPSGKVAIGGGAEIHPDPANDVAVVASKPSALDGQGKRTGWVATGREIGGDDPESWSVEAFVVCAQIG